MAEIVVAVDKDQEDLARSLLELERALQTLERDESRDVRASFRGLDRCLAFLTGAGAEKVNLIVERLRDRNPTAAEASRDLSVERDELVELAGRLSTVAARARAQSATERGAVCRIGREFLAAARWRIQRVEQQILPMAMVLLDADDWKEIDARLSEASGMNEGRS